ncbi:hypothetical protein ACMG4J_22460 [Rossellomorea marisflavi]|uniref:hypothetical protein n=1 Tax=Rossellomorea marisflavi TaxID=189381 RepID=UPI0039BEF2DD
MAGQVEKLVLRVSSISFVNLPDEQGPGVHLQFSGSDSKDEVRLNGYIPVTQMEYFAHAQSLESLVELVREKVLAKFEPDQEESAAE